MLILIQNGMKLIFYPSRYGLIRIDLMNSFFMEKCGWPKKNIFLNFNFFLIFLDFSKKNKNKITYKKIL